jgi:hypothetical protein
MCRKAHGAALASYAAAKRSDFFLLTGEQDVGAYHSSAEVTRTFCKRCGSPLQFTRSTRPDTFSLALGTLDDDPLVRPSSHIFVASKASWFEITDNLPRYLQRATKVGE